MIDSIWLVLGGALGFLWLVAYFRALRKNADLIAVKSIMDALFDTIQPGAEFDKAAARLLQTVSRIVEAGGYYLYLQDPHIPGTLVLKASLNAASDATVHVSYSGLFEYGEDLYLPPLNLDAASQPREVSVVPVGVPAMLVVPLTTPEGSIEGAIHAGPIRPPRLKKSAMITLRSIQPALSRAAAVILEYDRLQGASIRAIRYVEASTAATTSAYHPSQLVATLAALGARLLAADSWLAYVREQFRPRDYRPLWGGVSNTVGEEVVRELESGLPDRAASEVVIMSQEAAARSPIAPLIRGIDKCCVVWVPLAYDGRQLGVLAYLVRSSAAPDAQKIQALTVVANRMGAALADLKGQERLQESYVETLKAMVLITDSQEPYTQGHSERISRYSGLIAAELGLPARDQEAVRLAGYLHDVGMSTLSGSLLSSDRRFTQIEYDAMKAHTIVGSALVEPVFDPAPIAAMVKHHHERYDGLGYPDGLRGEEIPIGARIIAVADTYLAKVSSRGYRDALPFGKALKDLKDASGTQLDPKVVDALLRVFQRLRSDPHRAGRPLEPCWQMIQCPKAIRSLCPAGDADHACWSLRGTQCRLHGDECRRCVVFTEHEDRLNSTQRVARNR